MIRFIVPIFVLGKGNSGAGTRNFYRPNPKSSSDEVSGTHRFSAEQIATLLRQIELSMAENIAGLGFRYTHGAA
jgi:hypothetical protein